MNPHRLLVLVAVVLATSACASNDVKPQAVTAPLASVTAYAVSTDSAAAHPSPTAAPISEVAPATAGPVPTDQMTQAELDAEVLYSEELVPDPWEGYNRRMHSVNNAIDKYFARPLAVAYDKVTPEPVQSSVSRFFRNLREPLTAVNQALQGRPGHAGQSLGRFAVNTTVGIGGLFDPATRFGMERRDGEDFGQTMAVWGWEDSRYLVMPLFGPRTVRDAVAIVGDQPLSPIGYVEDSGVANALTILQLVDVRSQVFPMDEPRRQALDEYAFVRDAWAQRRKHQIEKDLQGSRD